MADFGSIIGSIFGGDVAPALGGIFDVYSAWSDQAAAAQRANEMQALATALAQQQAQLGRAQFEIDRNLLDRILQQTGDYRNALIQAQQAMGAYGGSYFDPVELEAETGRRFAIYEDQVNRAIDRVASVEAADRIRSGMDASTLAVDERAAMADQAARAMQDAYARARDEALQYISGVKAQEYLGMDQMAKQRAGALAEIGAVLGTTIPLETQLYGGGQAGLSGSSSAAYHVGNLYGSLSDRASGASQALGETLNEFYREHAPRLADWLRSSGSSQETPYWRTPGFRPPGIK